jgi:hypothetical protein
MDKLGTAELPGEKLGKAVPLHAMEAHGGGEV